MKERIKKLEKNVDVLFNEINKYLQIELENAERKDLAKKEEIIGVILSFGEFTNKVMVVRNIRKIYQNNINKEIEDDVTINKFNKARADLNEYCSNNDILSLVNLLMINNNPFINDISSDNYASKIVDDTYEGVNEYIEELTSPVVKEVEEVHYTKKDLIKEVTQYLKNNLLTGSYLSDKMIDNVTEMYLSNIDKPKEVRAFYSLKNEGLIDKFKSYEELDDFDKQKIDAQVKFETKINEILDNMK